MQGRIVKGIAGFYYVSTGDGHVYECKAKGIFRKNNVKPLVGDDVMIEIINNEEGTGNITDILPRRNMLIRPPVANVDQAVVLFAIVRPDPNYNVLDKFLIQMRQNKLPVIICFNKQDIATKEEQQELMSAYENCGYEVLFISAREGAGIDELCEKLRGKTSVIAGPSGAGKSSLLNRLHPEADMETGELSKKIARGKNTTRHSEMFFASSLSDENEKTYILDTPGFTSLSLYDMTAEELGTYYPEFEPYEPSCRFRGCSHIAEPNCGVKEALKEGRISKVRYDNYKMIYEELKNRKPVYR